MGGWWEMSVMKCEICLWRRRGVCEGVGNQEGCDEREQEMISWMLAQAIVLQPAVPSLPRQLRIICRRSFG